MCRAKRKEETIVAKENKKKAEAEAKLKKKEVKSYTSFFHGVRAMRIVEQL